MKFIHLLHLVILTSQIVFAQNATYIKGNKYEGYIFDKTHTVFGSIENQKDRYTPTFNDVKCVESILNGHVDYLKKNQPEKLNGYPIIYKNLKKYIRQYVGYINKNGEIVIWINFLMNYNDQPNISKDIVSIYDGGSYYWSIYINLTQKKLYNMRVNGVS